MKRIVFIVAVVSFVFGCAAAPKTGSDTEPEAASPHASSRIVPCSAYSMDQVFVSAVDALESMDKEIVSSVRNEDAAKVTARQQTADAYDYWEVVLTYQRIQKSEVIRMSVSMTSDDPARIFEEEDADAFWDQLWEVGKIMAF